MVTEEEIREFISDLHRLHIDERRLEDRAKAAGQLELEQILERVRWTLDSAFSRTLEAHGRVVLGEHLKAEIKDLDIS